MIKTQFYTKINTKNGFRGAQLKTWDYFNFINSHPKFEAKIKFHQSSEWSDDVTWEKKQVLRGGELFERPDLLVLKGGQDWLLFKKQFNYSDIPIISPIVNYRVLNEDHPSNQLLELAAVRVCPNSDLKNKLIHYPKTKGQVVCIPHGVNLPSKLIPINHKNIDLLIIALKNKKLGRQVFDYYKTFGKNVVFIDNYISHQEFMHKISVSKVSLHLPQPAETFYIPGLESLSMGVITIMPDCLGNIDYVKKIEGGFLCGYNFDEIINKTNWILNLPLDQLDVFSQQAFLQSKAFSIEKERLQWHELLEQVFNLQK
ncbi:MAG: hypothetical protein R3E90_06585 [Marinicella sp.]